MSLQDAASHLRRDLYRAARNVHCRLISELKKGNEVRNQYEACIEVPNLSVVADIVGAFSNVWRDDSHH